MTTNEQLLREMLGDAAFDALSAQDRDDLLEGDIGWIRDLLEARRQLPIAEPSALLSQTLRDLFDEGQPVVDYEAVLVRDSRVDRRLVGVRGVAPTHAWSMSFVCEIADVVLDVVAFPDQIVVDAHVISHGPAALAYRAHATPANDHNDTNESPLAMVESDRLGQMHLGSMDPTAYRITFSNTRSVIHVDADFGPVQ